MSSSYSCRSNSIVCLSHPVPGDSCLLQSLCSGARAARMMGMGGHVDDVPTPLYIYLFTYYTITYTMTVLFPEDLVSPYSHRWSKPSHVYQPSATAARSDVRQLSDSTQEGCALIGSFYGPFILRLTWLYRKSWHGTNAQGLPKPQEPLKGG